MARQARRDASTPSPTAAESRDGDPGEIATLAEIRRLAAGCQRCDLYKHATQVVTGEGSDHARLVLVGEQPGDQEDRQGHPFVGPAGRLLDQCLQEAELDRDECYVTNAVKHFKFERRGKRRIHERPNAGEVQACKWWLDKELKILKPRLAVALGATAVRALLGRAVGVMKQRGQILPGPDGLQILVTVHPSYLLRIPDSDAAERARAAFIEDLRKIHGVLGK
ncbi:UdgX family uracil-DNA binding protein [Labrys sp. LIt4]|uniref:UdgX family uracil-DNA binding protein n=1 Tax=Labrys sp. LIt4 TaxID=2821355 RepID=UPI001AE0B99E|nr:UdgX family uracil-DNA binding protein [Labrys sp. LIt4]MBP0581240.1 UdgX family uracil-DNA binding protein [Labrys sp. LIt4]